MVAATGLDSRPRRASHGHPGDRPASERLAGDPVGAEPRRRATKVTPTRALRTRDRQPELNREEQSFPPCGPPRCPYSADRRSQRGLLASLVRAGRRVGWVAIWTVCLVGPGEASAQDAKQPSTPPAASRRACESCSAVLASVRTLYSRGSVDLALAVAERQLVECSRCLPLRYRRGWLLLMAANPSVALEDFDACLSADPDYAEAYYAAGFCWKELGDLSRARELYERASTYDSTATIGTIALAFTDIELGRLQLGIDSLVRAREKAPRDSAIVAALAKALEMSGALDRASEVAREALALNPRDVDAMDVLASVAFERGFPEETLRWCIAVLAHDAQSPGALERAVYCHAILGDSQQARLRLQALETRRGVDPRVLSGCRSAVEALGREGARTSSSWGRRCVVDGEDGFTDPVVLASFADLAIDELTRVLALPPASGPPIRIRLCGSRAEVHGELRRMSVKGVTLRAAGIFEPQTGMCILEGGPDPWRVRSRLVHELTHALRNRIPKGARGPRWYEEGIADYCGDYMLNGEFLSLGAGVATWADVEIAREFRGAAQSLGLERIGEVLAGRREASRAQGYWIIRRTLVSRQAGRYAGIALPSVQECESSWRMLTERGRSGSPTGLDYVRQIRVADYLRFLSGVVFPGSTAGAL